MTSSGPNDDEHTDPTPLLRGFGNQIRTLREHRSLSRHELGERAGFSGSMIGAFERGDRIADSEAAKLIDVALNAHGVLAVMGDELDQEKYPRRFGRFFRLEAEAVSLCIYDTHIINGLLQTESYALALFNTRLPYREADEIDRLLTERIARQALLTRTPPAVLSFVIEQAALSHRYGGKETTREQLLHLLELGKLPNVTIQVMPMDCEEPVGAAGPLTLVETPKHRMFGYTEVQERGDLISDHDEVSTLTHRYGIIRGHALRPAASARLIRDLAEEL
ncbi:helix-turn-helix transcriptional regulator [Streptomyces sp. JJ66]|uniref:helix-turn-helix domain-containing protein n=1 Tax=Streptomyces sp. JJ66 TaxID=2803843 RepID=UPI001C580BEA|nr:helix-turn-helix transcriptional regulator [Streptomyces sp. JJ66]MBW1601703.1 helix-turn-helix transcriptional regulator [Streptomyces sp. JJ66]